MINYCWFNSTFMSKIQRLLSVCTRKANGSQNTYTQERENREITTLITQTTVKLVKPHYCVSDITTACLVLKCNANGLQKRKGL